MSQRTVALLGLLVALGVTPSLQAKDFVLALGGGPAPGSSEVSLEQNVFFFRGALSPLGLANAEYSVLFASGRGLAPDVCFEAPSQAPAANRLLSEIFGPAAGLSLNYRHHGITPVQGPMTRSAVLAKLHELAEQTDPGDRLLLYLTGHGGKGSSLENGHFHTWKNEKIDAREFAGALDGFDPAVEVAVVMVHCYGGSFANIIFKQGDPDKGLAPHKRAGFFATVSSRPAAGCTPDVKVADYQEYSTYFWAALSGRDRLGRPSSPSDLDADGAISLAEAHAFTVAESPTIDIPVKTSDRFLRVFGRFDPRDSRLFQHDRDFSRLVAVANPPERMALERLSRQLKLGGENRVSEAVRKADELVYERKGDQETIASLRAANKRLEGRMAAALLARWPFLKNPWHPETQKLLADPKEQALTVLRQHPSHATWARDRERIDALQKRDLENEKTWAKLQRLIQTAESVALAQNLKSDPKPELLQQYSALVELENRFLKAKIRQLVSRDP